MQYTDTLQADPHILSESAMPHLLTDHPSCKIPRCNSANILEPVLTGFKSLKIDENA